MSERVLLVGGGGREHAIARAVAASDRSVELVACAGTRNPGIASVSMTYETLDETDPSAVVDFAEKTEPTLAVIGPEAPLEAGVVDALDDRGVYAFGPFADDARIETDKAFQREFMASHDITGCPEFAVFTAQQEASAYLDEVSGDVAVKPRGLTGGKGVRVTGDQLSKSEAKSYILESEYSAWVIEERLYGEEFTLQAFVANGSLQPTPAVQDHKRAFEGDEGPNTGGMGSYSAAGRTLPFMTQGEYDAAVDILREVVAALPSYRGVLYGQFMLTADGPKVVEFNARFGDPEAMNTLPVLESDFVDILVAGREGDPVPSISFRDKATVCKYAVPDGYPADPDGGSPLNIDPSLLGDALLFYASVDERPDGLFTTTSRSFAVVGVADSITSAEAIVDEALLSIDTEGLRVRHDIGTPALIDQRVEHMESLRGGEE